MSDIPPGFEEQSEKIDELVQELFEIIDEQGANVINSAAENDELDISREEGHIMRPQADVMFAVNELLEYGCDSHEQKIQALMTLLEIYTREMQE